MHDMRVVKKLGFNMLKLQESWCIDEKREGEVTLDKVETLVEEAEKLGLFIYFGVTMEQAPAWLWKKYPDCCLVYSTGEEHEDPTQYLLPSDGKPGPCWDHQGAREAGARFIGELARRLSRYDNILVWNIWQEIGFWSMRDIPGSLGFCYCPNTLRRFKEWLREKYGDLDALNRVWCTGYADWEEVAPPHVFPMVPSFIDWRYFMDDVYLSRALSWKAEAFRAHDPKNRPIFSHVGGPTVGSGAEWRWAKQGDVFGSSCYPTWNPFHLWDYGFPGPGKPAPRDLSLLYEVESTAMRYDYIRCAAGSNRQCWAAEFQGGPVSTSLHKGRVPSPEDIQRWVLAALSSGIQGLSFWNHRAEIFWSEAYGFGLLDAHGDSSSRAEEAGRLAKAVNHYPELFHEGYVSQTDVAIFVNEDLWHFAQATGNDAATHLSYTTRGIYNMLWESGIWVDFVEASETSLESLGRYKAVILPFPLALSDKTFNLLKNYVVSGGVLISEACPGRYDQFGFMHSGELSVGAEEVFGVEQRTVQLCHEPRQPPRWTPIERSYGEIRPATRFEGAGTYSRHSVLPSLYVATYTTKTSTPVLTCKDEVTGVVNEFGRGKTYLIGTFLGHAYAAFRDEATLSFLLALLDSANVKPELCGELRLRRRIGEDSEGWFLFNMTPEPITAKVRIKDFSSVKDLLNSVTSKSGTVTVKVDPFAIRCLILKD
jgi:beta-galactosidase GanA